ncbi:MAG: hypothetical protein HY716_15755 [Planctomycetes bacterium]|nr:hypothetical protein [Planctomycetota bacterium]
MTDTPKPTFDRVPSPREIEWRRILERWKQSGLGGRAFCQREGLKDSLFYHWKRRIRQRDEARGNETPRERRGGMKFLPVKVAPTPMPAFEIVLAGGRVVRVASSFDEKALAKLLSVVEGSRC